MCTVRPPLPRGLGLSPQGFGPPSPSWDVPRAPAPPVGGCVEGRGGTSTGVRFRETVRAKLPCEGPGRDTDPTGQWDRVPLGQEVGEGNLLGWMERVGTCCPERIFLSALGC